MKRGKGYAEMSTLRQDINTKKSRVGHKTFGQGIERKKLLMLYLLVSCTLMTAVSAISW